MASEHCWRCTIPIFCYAIALGKWSQSVEFAVAFGVNKQIYHDFNLILNFVRFNNGWETRLTILFEGSPYTEKKTTICEENSEFFFIN